MPESPVQGASSDRPNLLERTFAAGCTRIAVVSLHPGAGARTVVESIAGEFHRRGIPLGVTRAPRVPLEADDARAQVEPIFLAEGTIVATTSVLAEGNDCLEPLEAVEARTALGDVALYRVARCGEVLVYGPDDPSSLAQVMARLEANSGGLALVDGAWERRRFAAPDVAQGVVPVVGSAYSGNPERSAAALKHLVEVLHLPRCREEARAAWQSAAAQARPVALDGEGAALAWLPADDADPLPALEGKTEHVDTLVVPDRLRNGLLAPLCRSELRCTLVVRDATRIEAAPVHRAAWSKNGGTIRTVEPMQVLAVATNPVNPTGADADPDSFRHLVTETLPDIPVHDVRLESAGEDKGGRRWWPLRGRSDDTR